jgi:hypothetical protein
VITKEQATKLLDEVLYARVLECIDLGKLLGIELDLWAALCEQTGASEMAAREEAKAMLDRALARFASADARYVPMAPFGPFGMDCPDCEDEAAEARRRRHGQE